MWWLNWLHLKHLSFSLAFFLLAAPSFEGSWLPLRVLRVLPLGGVSCLGLLSHACLVRQLEQDEQDHLQLQVEELESSLSLVHKLSLPIDPVSILHPLQKAPSLLHLVLSPDDVELGLHCLWEAHYVSFTELECSDLPDVL